MLESLFVVLIYNLEGYLDGSFVAEQDEDVVTVDTEMMSVCLFVFDYCD